MAEQSVVLDREATSSGTVASASLASRHHLVRYADEIRKNAVRVPYFTVNEPLFVADNVLYTGNFHLWEEGVCPTLRGTIVPSSAFRQWPLNSFSCGLISMGVADATQYLLNVERRNDLRTPRTFGRPFNAGELTRRALELSGLTRDQLATAIGVRRQSVHNWLAGRAGMSTDNQEKLQGLVSLFERASRKMGDPRRVSRWLTTSVEGEPSPLELLAVSSFDAVRGRLLRSAPVRGASIMSPQISQGIPRRTGPIGQRPPWKQPSRTREFDPEEEGNTVMNDGLDEPYRDTQPPRVTGIARA